MIGSVVINVGNSHMMIADIGKLGEKGCWASISHSGKSAVVEYCFSQNCNMCKFYISDYEKDIDIRIGEHIGLIGEDEYGDETIR